MKQYCVEILGKETNISQDLQKSSLLRLSNSMVKLSVLTCAVKSWAVRRNMIAVVLTPDFVDTLTDLFGWQHRIVIAPTVVKVTVVRSTVVGTPSIEFRLFSVACSEFRVVYWASRLHQHLH